MNCTCGTLICAAEKGCVRCVEKFCKKKRINVNAKNKDGDTALSLAVQKGHIKIVGCVAWKE